MEDIHVYQTDHWAQIAGTSFAYLITAIIFYHLFRRRIWGGLIGLAIIAGAGAYNDPLWMAHGLPSVIITVVIFGIYTRKVPRKKQTSGAAS